jgi:hypothetical protein
MTDNRVEKNGEQQQRDGPAVHQCGGRVAALYYISSSTGIEKSLETWRTYFF